MTTIVRYIIALCILTMSQMTMAQTDQIGKWEQQKREIEKQEKEALKLEVDEINQRLDKGEISQETAAELKMEAAEKHALNIENRVAIIDNKMALYRRNGNELPTIDDDGKSSDGDDFKVTINGRTIIGADFDEEEVRYDVRTTSDPVLAFGFNNTIMEGGSLNDSPYKLGGSRFAELGWVWRTRVFKNSNFLRFSYGVSFQFNGLKPNGNQYFVTDGKNSELTEFQYTLDKSKFRTDNLVVPVHLEFGPSKTRKTENYIRYSIENRFRIGIGGYAGVNLGARQKLKYEVEGANAKDKIKKDYNTTDFVYGVSTYMGFGGMQLYLKYDLSPLFYKAEVEQNNISLGLRFDL
ncbi:MAG: hypothetical protein AB3N16_02230 [Flavobacteriaceae bacterium]